MDVTIVTDGGIYISYRLKPKPLQICHALTKAQHSGVQHAQRCFFVKYVSLTMLTGTCLLFVIIAGQSITKLACPAITYMNTKYRPSQEQNGIAPSVTLKIKSEQLRHAMPCDCICDYLKT